MVQGDLKASVRRSALERRKAAHETGRDADAAMHLADYLAPHAGRVLAGYMASGSEIDPDPVMTSWNGDVVLPVVDGPQQRLGFRRWSAGAPMEIGAYGIPVPASPETLEPEILIVPLVAFDGRGNRLGYGGGFYDRTLADLRARAQILAVGFAYRAQEAAALPVEETDQPLDAVVTEAGVRSFAG
ncbi:MAG: 5-formyltetrahydrofolate cyclo-ligase [Pseudomonadota bacterium]